MPGTPSAVHCGEKELGQEAPDRWNPDLEDPDSVPPQKEVPEVVSEVVDLDLCSGWPVVVPGPPSADRLADTADWRRPSTAGCDQHQLNSNLADLG